MHTHRVETLVASDKVKAALALAQPSTHADCHLGAPRDL